MILKKTTYIILTFLLFSISLIAQEQIPKAEKGVLDLRGYNFDENVKLTGEWEFYWNKLYDYYDFENNVYTPDSYLKVPGDWSDVEVDGEKISDTGYATFRLVIFIEPKADREYVIHFGEVLTAYKVWWNNRVIIETGNVATNSDDGKPAIAPVLKSVKVDKEKIQLIVQISNYHHRTNGFFQVPVLGEEQSIYKGITYKFFADIFIFGAVIIMAFYHLGIFLYRRQNKPALAFFVLSLIVGIRILFSSNYTFNFLFPDFSWKIVYTFSYLTFYGMVASFIYFFQVTFQGTKYKLFFWISYIVTGLFLLTIFLPTLVYTKFTVYYQICVVLMIIFCVFLLIRYIIQKKVGAVTLSITMLLFFISGINDILYFNNVINTTTLTHVGLFVLVLGQSLTLGRIFNKAFIRNEELTQELDYHNKNLQNLVKERTKEIELQKQDILQKNEELQVQKEELQVQKEEILRQKELLSQHNKLLTDSVNYASTIQVAVLPTNDAIKKYFNGFIIYLPKDIVSGDFYWFNDTNPNYLYFIIGDCTGHGVPGAFLSLIVVYLLNSIVNEKKIEDPKEILHTLNSMFNDYLHKRDNQNRDGVELGIIRFDKNNMQNIVYSAAKTNIFIYSAIEKSLHRYRGTRKSIGFSAVPNSNKALAFENLEIKMDSNNTLYCATDGFVDQNDKSRKRFGTKAFINMITESANLPLQQQKISYIKALENFKREEPQRDDITFIALKFKD